MNIVRHKHGLLDTVVKSIEHGVCALVVLLIKAVDVGLGA
jgi:hypothetical protein